VVSFESDPGEYVSQESKNTRAIPHGSGRIVGPEVFKISSSEGITAISPYFHECIEYAYIFSSTGLERRSQWAADEPGQNSKFFCALVPT
jgi:hypothetical protein